MKYFKKVMEMKENKKNIIWKTCCNLTVIFIFTTNVVFGAGLPGVLPDTGLVMTESGTITIDGSGKIERTIEGTPYVIIADDSTQKIIKREGGEDILVWSLETTYDGLVYRKFGTTNVVEYAAFLKTTGLEDTALNIGKVVSKLKSEGILTPIYHSETIIKDIVHDDSNPFGGVFLPLQPSNIFLPSDMAKVINSLIPAEVGAVKSATITQREWIENGEEFRTEIRIEDSKITKYSDAVTQMKINTISYDGDGRMVLLKGVSGEGDLAKDFVTTIEYGSNGGYTHTTEVKDIKGNIVETQNFTFNNGDSYTEATLTVNSDGKETTFYSKDYLDFSKFTITVVKNGGKSEDTYYKIKNPKLAEKLGIPWGEDAQANGYLTISGKTISLDYIDGRIKISMTPGNNTQIVADLAPVSITEVVLEAIFAVTTMVSIVYGLYALAAPAAVEETVKSTFFQAMKSRAIDLFNKAAHPLAAMGAHFRNMTVLSVLKQATQTAFFWGVISSTRAAFNTKQDAFRAFRMGWSMGFIFGALTSISPFTDFLWYKASPVAAFQRYASLPGISSFLPFSWQQALYSIAGSSRIVMTMDVFIAFMAIYYGAVKPISNLIKESVGIDDNTGYSEISTLIDIGTFFMLALLLRPVQTKFAPEIGGNQNMRVPGTGEVILKINYSNYRGSALTHPAPQYLRMIFTESGKLITEPISISDLNGISSSGTTPAINAGMVEIEVVTLKNGGSELRFQNPRTGEDVILPIPSNIGG